MPHAQFNIGEGAYIRPLRLEHRQGHARPFSASAWGSQGDDAITQGVPELDNSQAQSLQSRSSGLGGRPKTSKPTSSSYEERSRREQS